MERPWLKHYGAVAHHLNYPDCSISGQVLKTAARLPKSDALSFMGKRISYAKMAEKIEQAACAFWALGIRKGDRVLLCLPNLPQTVYCLYGLNRLGAVVGLIHPLAAEKEIAQNLKEVGVVTFQMSIQSLLMCFLMWHVSRSPV